jgi:hypothetical protein
MGEVSHAGEVRTMTDAPRREGLRREGRFAFRMGLPIARDPEQLVAGGPIGRQDQTPEISHRAHKVHRVEFELPWKRLSFTSVRSVISV